MHTIYFYFSYELSFLHSSILSERKSKIIETNSEGGIGLSSVENRASVMLEEIETSSS